MEGSVGAPMEFMRGDVASRRLRRGSRASDEVGFLELGPFRLLAEGTLQTCGNALTTA